MFIEGESFVFSIIATAVLVGLFLIGLFAVTWYAMSTRHTEMEYEVSYFITGHARDVELLREVHTLKLNKFRSAMEDALVPVARRQLSDKLDVPESVIVVSSVRVLR